MEAHPLWWQFPATERRPEQGGRPTEIRLVVVSGGGSTPFLIVSVCDEEEEKR